MKLGVLHTVLPAALLTVLATACHDSARDISLSGNAAYYWRTTWQPSPKEKEFVEQHHINRLYLRLFDVVGEYEPGTDGEKGQLVPMPRATLHLNEPYALQCEVVPVVFVTDECLAADPDLAKKIVRRVGQFCETNDLIWNELQVDCDWRPSTRDDYFRFLENARAELQLMNKKGLSATIRLHQFSQPAPPVDYGVLMCYNTGNLRDNSTTNAILETKEVRKYAGRLKDYPLPLSAAYPIFTWKRLFRGGKFVALLNSVDVGDSTLFKNCEEGIYRVKTSFSAVTPDPSIFGLQLVPGDTVKLDFVPADTIANVKRLLEAGKPAIHKQTIVYSLNETDFTKYKSDEITSIYSSNQ